MLENWDMMLIIKPILMKQKDSIVLDKLPHIKLMIIEQSKISKEI